MSGIFSQPLALLRLALYVTTRARMFWTRWSASNVAAGAPYSRELQKSIRVATILHAIVVASSDVSEWRTWLKACVL